MENIEDFGDSLDQLVTGSHIALDRPRGSAHPRYPTVVYPVDYGYLEDTATIDGGGIDVWVGSTGADRPDAILCTVDLLTRDAEIKLLIGCSEDEKVAILRFLNANAMRGIFLRRG